MQIILLPQAQENLEAIAEPLLSRVCHRLETLREFPELGAPLIGSFAGYRSTVIDLFRVIYRILPNQIIEIAYIRDCRQKPLT